MSICHLTAMLFYIFYIVLMSETLKICSKIIGYFKNGFLLLFQIRSKSRFQDFLQVMFFLKKMSQPSLFFIYFRSYQTNNIIVTTNQCEKCPNVHPVFGIQTHDLSNMSRHPKTLDQGSRQNNVMSLTTESISSE